MIRAVCDASIMFKLVVTEPATTEAHSFVQSNHVIVPEFVFAEVANGLWARVTRGDLNVEESTRLIEGLIALRLDVRATRDLISRALRLASAMRHPIYDCLYLALAEREGVPLVTADQRFLNAVRRAKLEVAEVRLLSFFG